MLTIHFDETGGYDCMTGAWIIQRDGQTLVEIDQTHYGQESCDYNYRSSRAHSVAHIIFEALERVI